MRSIGLLLSILISLTCNATPVEIPDPVLDLEIRRALGYYDGPLQKEDLLQLTVLDIAWCQHGCSVGWIYSLEGIEYCQNLRVLNIRYHYVTDLSPLENLDQLEMLDLRCNPINDIFPLARSSFLGPQTTILVTDEDLNLVSGSDDWQSLESLRESRTHVVLHQAEQEFTCIRMVYATKVVRPAIEVSYESGSIVFSQGSDKSDMNEAPRFLVRIYDTTGTLVYATHASNSTAQWDSMYWDDTAVPTGIYGWRIDGPSFGCWCTYGFGKLAIFQ